MIGQTLGHYRILEKVAAGGMGVVYRARDEHLERDVALKVLPRGTLNDESSRRHFRQEALALAKLNHPNIETVYEFGTEEGVDFLVMEYVPGRTLANKLTDGPLAEKEVLALAIQITLALEDAHECGIVHRDLKPANIALTAKGQAKVLDFGLATFLRPEEEITKDQLTDSLAIAGTLPYMSPEQLDGERVDARTDIYTLGAVVYEMATGRRAFTGELASQVINAILHQAPVTPRAINARTSPELETIILKCLEKDPAQRYQSAKELLVDLRRLAGRSSVVVAPTRIRKWRWVWILVAALITVLSVVVALNLAVVRQRIAGSPRIPRIQSLAVLPLENQSRDSEQDYFADGMTDELITELGRISSIKVISHTSIMRYKNTDRPMTEIAKALHVDGLVEGSIQRSGGRIRISARLIDARGDPEQQIWARSYERDLNDALVLQREVAEAIVGSMAVTLKPSEQANLNAVRTVDHAAYEAYLKGNYYWNKRTAESLKKALYYFEEAIEKDPGYSMAYVGLSYTYAFAPELGIASNIATAKQKAAALKAVQLDGELAEAHTALGSALQNEWNWAGAETQYRRAIELNSNYATTRHWYSLLLTILGRHAEAIAEAQRAMELDPLSLIIQSNLGGRYLYAGRYEDAIRECKKALDLDPSFMIAHDCLGFARLQQGRINEAITELQTAAGSSSSDPESLAAIGYAYAVLGKTRDAKEIATKLKHLAAGAYVPAYYVAIVQSGLGQKDEAMQWLERAYRNRSAELPGASVEPMLKNLHGDSRFRNLLNRMGLPDLEPEAIN
jgi:eukaryotic-like serine/threonine-protein kinase